MVVAEWIIAAGALGSFLGLLCRWLLNGEHRWTAMEQSVGNLAKRVDQLEACTSDPVDGLVVRTTRLETMKGNYGGPYSREQRDKTRET